MQKRTGFVRKLMVSAAFACGALAAGGMAFAHSGVPLNSPASAEATFAIYGDAPYGTSPTDTAEFEATPAFIQSINTDSSVEFVVHVGDIHSGHQYCTEAYDESIYGLWTHFERPLVYTPGDNEWTDCHKNHEGGGTYDATTNQIIYDTDGSGNLIDYAGGDPIQNLDLIRAIFFHNPGYTLGDKQPVISQAQHFDSAHPTDASFVENVMWEHSNVLFVTLNLPGGSNNDQDPWYGAPTQSPSQTMEWTNRTGADLRWLDAAFIKAKADGMDAVLVAVQADMWDPEHGAAHQANYEPFLASIASHTLDFGKPVMLINGDSHVYRSDNPLVQTDSLFYMHPGYDVPNFHRIVVHGSTFPLEWLKVTIHPGVNAPASPNAFGPFSWERVVP